MRVVSRGVGGRVVARCDVGREGAERRVAGRRAGGNRDARGGIRTHDLFLRREALYPAELLAPTTAAQRITRLSRERYTG